MGFQMKHRWAIAGLPALLIGGLTYPDGSLAQERGGLRNLVADLYGGNGITLGINPAFPGGEFHPPHFESSSREQLFDLSNDILNNIAATPFDSASTSIVYDIEVGAPVLAREGLGPLLLRRAATIGAKRLSVGFSYTRLDYDQFEGDDVEDLTLDLPHIECCGPGGTPPADGVLGTPPFERDLVRLNLDLDIKQDIFAFYGTYGITDNWDVGAVVPIIHIDASVRSVYEVIERGGGGIHVPITDPTDEDFFRDSNSGSATGFGDLILRTKYNFLRGQPVIPDAAVLGQVTLPTGDEDDLLGTGETGFLGLLIGSKDFGRFRVHGNLGYEVFTGDVEDNLRYGVGTDVMLLESVAGVVEVIGRYEPGGEGTGDLVDAVVGAKWNPIGDVVLSTNLLIPINKDTGLRSDFIWGIGFEIGF